MNYATTYRPGYFSHETEILTVHATELDAMQEADKHAYKDGQGNTRYPICVVYHPAGFSVGAWVYGDNFPDVLS